MIELPGDTSDEESGGLKVDLTAMIDVIFTVIAFMMIIINVPVHMMEVDLPNAEDADANAVGNNLVLHVIADQENWQINGETPLDRAATLTQLKARMESLSEPLPILVTIDEAAPVQRMVDTFALLQEGKFEHISIVAESGSP